MKVFLQVLLGFALMSLDAMAEIQNSPNPRALSWQEFLSLPGDSPVIIDNDSFYDVPGHYYLFALASLGKANLRGIVVTPSGDNERDPERVKGALRDLQDRIDLARKAGMQGIPDAVLGSLESDYFRPGSLVIEDTTIAKTSPGSELIAREARAAAASGKKLLVAVGGAASSVAVAYLTDPLIADHMVVVAIGINVGANGLHEWGSWIVSKRLKLAHYSTHNHFPNADPAKRTPGEWWPQRAEDLTPQASIDRVPNAVMRAELQRLRDRWAMLFKDDPTFVIEGYGDSEGYWVGSCTTRMFTEPTNTAGRAEFVQDITCFTNRRRASPKPMCCGSASTTRPPARRSSPSSNTRPCITVGNERRK